MTIQLPGNDFSGLQGIGELIQSFVNPDKKRQEALRQALLSGRVDQQTLVDMGPDAVEAAYGKGTSKVVKGKKSAKSILNEYTGAQIADIMSLPETDQRKIDFRAKLVGIDTPTETKIKENAATVGGQTIEANKLTLEDKRSDLEKQTQNRILANRAIMKVGGKGNLYAAYQKGAFTPEEVTALHSDPDVSKTFESQRSDWWKAQELELTRKSIDQRVHPDKIFEQADALNAKKVSDLANYSDTESIFNVMRDPKLRDLVQGLDEEKAKKAGDQTYRIWRAVQAIDKANSMEGADRKRLALDSFRRETQGIRAQLTTEKARSRMTPNDIQAAVDQYNTIAAATLSPYMSRDEVPQLTFDEKGPQSKRDFFGIPLSDAKTLYFSSGMDSDFVDAAKKTVERTDDQINTAAQLIVDGKATEAETLMGVGAATKQKLLRRIQELRGKKK